MLTPDRDESYAVHESQTSQRKRDHIEINLQQDVSHKMSTGLESYRFTHNPLPEIDLDQVDTSTKLLNHRLRAPLLVSSMTGGTEEAGQVNNRLAEAAQT